MKTCLLLWKLLRNLIFQLGMPVNNTYLSEKISHFVSTCHIIMENSCTRMDHFEFIWGNAKKKDAGC